MWVAIALAAGVVAYLALVPDESPATAHGRTSPIDPRARRLVARARHLLGRLSARVPPTIARPEVGSPITTKELAPVLERYQASICAHWSRERERVADPDIALDMARMAADSDREAMLSALSVDGISRTASAAAISYVAERARADRDQACSVHALVDFLRLWPEAEPGSYLAQVARDPPGGSLLVTCAALDAMGQTGRADYVPELASHVQPGADSRVLVNAVDASTTILGDAELATRLLSSEFTFDEQLAGGLPHALAVGEGPGVVRVVEGLVSSPEPGRRLAAFRAAAQGAGLPEALLAVVDAARAPGTTREEASRTVDAIQQVGGEGAPAQLLALARDRRISPMMRGISLLEAGPAADAERLGLEIARETTDVSLALALARAAHRADPGVANRILDAFARNADLEADLLRNLRAADSGSLRELSASYFDQAVSDQAAPTER